MTSLPPSVGRGVLAISAAAGAEDALARLAGTEWVSGQNCGRNDWR